MRRFAVGLIPFLWVGACAFPASSDATTVRLPATADTYVVREQPRANFGTDRRLRVSARGLGRAYVRFDLRGVRRIDHAELRLRTLGRRRVALRVARASSAWKETTIDFVRAPLARGARVDARRATRGRWIGADVTRLLRGRRTVTLAIWSAGGRGAIASRELRGSAPHLVLSEPVTTSWEPASPPSPAAVTATTTGAMGATGGATPAPVADPREAYWGAYVAGGRYGLTDAPWDMRSLEAFQRSTRKAPSLIEWAQSWFECSSTCGMRPFRADLMQRVRDRGAIPVLSWGSYDERGGTDQPDFQLADIIAGRYDDFIDSWARGAAAWGHPFFLRFDWEMNTNGVPYSEHSNGNQRGEFARMWRHVHDRFSAAGAANVTWVWCPNVEYEGSVKPLASLYPGDDVVDWTCLDGYNWGTNPSRPAGWASPAEVLAPSYDLLTRSIAPGKPVMIGETAATESGGSKAAWIRELLSDALPVRMPEVGAVVWFNKDWDGMDWPIETSDAARDAFAGAIAAERYAASDFAGLDGSPIRPLGQASLMRAAP
jgi:hypothetical protein